ncbi:hypothetical protein D3C74_377370 [compost metagenome]
MISRVPPDKEVRLSAWIPSSPAVTLNSPSVTETLPLLCSASSAELIVKLPPFTVRSPPAFSPLALVDSVSAVAAVAAAVVTTAVVTAAVLVAAAAVSTAGAASVVAAEVPSVAP